MAKDTVKGYGVDIPIQGAKRFYVRATSPKEAIKKALEGNAEEEQEDEDVPFIMLPPTIATPALVQQITDDDEIPDDWDTTFDESDEASVQMAKDGTTVTTKLSNHYDRYIKAFVVPSANKNDTPSTPESKPGIMSNVVDTAISDTANASIRAGAAEFADMVREPTSEALLREIGFVGKGTSKVVGMFLKTPLGEGIFSYALGVALPLMVPIVPSDLGKKIIEVTGKELRVAGQTAMLRPLIRALREPLTEFVQSKMGMGKVLMRVDVGEGAKAENHEEEAETAAHGKKARR